RGRGGGGGGGGGGPQGVYELDLAKLLADSAAGTMKPRSAYERLCGQLPPGMNAGGGFGLDANEEVAYLGVRGGDVGQRLPEGTKLAEAFGPRGMGAGPSGIRSMNLKTGEIKFVVDVHFQIGHMQANPFNPGEIIFCWETGGKAPQRTWFVNADGSGLRTLYPEASYEWITHEAFIGKDEVAIAILGHRSIASATTNSDWGASGTMEHPTGVGVVNLRTRQMRIAGQVPEWSAGRSDWHVAGSSDGRWAACDDFQYEVWVFDRHSGESTLLAGPQKTGADHIHPTFNGDNTKIEIQSALISKDNRSLNIAVVPLPKVLLNRTYSGKLAE
ncbi:MAG: hypothetical protein ABUL66_04385, partial [Verrucomicrobiota bacterium]